MPNHHLGKLFQMFSTFRKQNNDTLLLSFLSFATVLTPFGERLTKLSRTSLFFSSVLCYTPKDFGSRSFSIVLSHRKFGFKLRSPILQDFISKDLTQCEDCVFLAEKLRCVLHTLSYDIAWEYVELLKTAHLTWDRVEGWFSLEIARGSEALFCFSLGTVHAMIIPLIMNHCSLELPFPHIILLVGCNCSLSC